MTKDHFCNVMFENSNSLKNVNKVRNQYTHTVNEHY